MNRKIWLSTLVFVCWTVSLGAVWAAKNASAKPESPLHIDIPVKLDKANVVVDVGKLIEVGDMPFLFGDMHFLANDLKQANVHGQIITIYHGETAFLILNDQTYNANRHVQTGNPYAKIIADLMQQGVQFELCGATAAANHWGNADLLPGVKINTDAMARVTQLEQEGYTLIFE